jgi:hypothetical protein
MSSLPEQQPPRPKPQVPLGRLLVERGLLTEQELIQALLEQNRTGERIGKVLIRLGYVDEPTVAMALASQHGGPLKTEYGFATGFETDPPAAQPTEADAPSNEASPTATAPAEDDPAEDGPAEEDPAEDEPAPSQVVPFTGTHSAHAALDAVHTRIADVEQELAVAHIRVADVQRELAAAHARNAELEQQLDAANTRSADLEPELDAANTRIAALEPELDAANTRIAALEPELEAVQSQLDEQRAQITEFEAKVANDRHAAETAIAALRGVAEGS